MQVPSNAHTCVSCSMMTACAHCWVATLKDGHCNCDLTCAVCISPENGRDCAQAPRNLKVLAPPEQCALQITAESENVHGDAAGGHPGESATVPPTILISKGRQHAYCHEVASAGITVRLVHAVNLLEPDLHHLHSSSSSCRLHYRQAVNVHVSSRGLCMPWVTACISITSRAQPMHRIVAAISSTFQPCHLP